MISFTHAEWCCDADIEACMENSCRKMQTCYSEVLLSLILWRRVQYVTYSSLFAKLPVIKRKFVAPIPTARKRKHRASNEGSLSRKTAESSGWNERAEESEPEGKKTQKVSRVIRWPQFSYSLRRRAAKVVRVRLPHGSSCAITQSISFLVPSSQNTLPHQRAAEPC